MSDEYIDEEDQREEALRQAKAEEAEAIADHYLARFYLGHAINGHGMTLDAAIEREEKARKRLIAAQNQVRKFGGTCGPTGEFPPTTPA